MAGFLRRLAPRMDVQVEITELDIQTDRRSDFTLPAVQKKWLQMIAQGVFFAVIVTPPCSTFSRAVWANDLGPYPVRSSTFPRGFPWNKGDRFHKAEFGTILADFSYEALKRQFACSRRVGLMEQPEDLGRTSNDRIPGHQPASMWQFVQFEQLLAMQGVKTVVFAQQDFGTSSPKPTRFLMRLFAPLHPAMHEGPPQFDGNGWYLGPLPRRSGGAPLIGKHQGVFKTAKSAAWPPALCRWTAWALLTSFLQEWSGGSELSKKRKAEDDLGAQKKAQKKGSEGAVPYGPTGSGGRRPSALLQVERVGRPISRWRRTGFTREVALRQEEEAGGRRMVIAWAPSTAGGCQGDG